MQFRRPVDHPLLWLFRIGNAYNSNSIYLMIVEQYSMIDFTSRQLRAFLLVAQHHSFTRAAGELLITPSGLSVLIREMENQLGVRLFDRTTRQVVLTTAGTQLLGVVQRNLQELLLRAASFREKHSPDLKSAPARSLFLKNQLCM